MRSYRTLLVVVATLTALTVPAPTASGQTHCPVVTGGSSGGCLIHFSGPNIELRKHVFGIESHITRCNWELDARLDESATGYLVNQALGNPSGGTCSRRPCLDGFLPLPWPAAGFETSGSEAMTVDLCVEPTGGGSDESCEIDFPLTATGTDRYRLGQAGEFSSHTTTGFKCELVGFLDSEIGSPGDQSVEIDHGAGSELEVSLPPPSPLELTNEGNATHCSTVTAQAHGAQGGCLVHMTSSGTMEVRRHIFGIESHTTACDSEFNVRIDEDGEGLAVNQVLSGQGCNYQPCDEDGGAQDPWQISALELGGGEAMEIQFCFELATGEQGLITFQLPLVETAEHSYAVGSNEELIGTSGPPYRFEMIGQWTTEAVPDIGAGEMEVEAAHV